jgi:hypothetical protein
MTIASGNPARESWTSGFGISLSAASFTALQKDDIREFFRILAEFPIRREALLSCLNNGLVSEFPTIPVPKDQLMSDLMRLNRLRGNGGAEMPLAEVLRSASILIEARDGNMASKLYRLAQVAETKSKE